MEGRAKKGPIVCDTSNQHGLEICKPEVEKVVRPWHVLYYYERPVQEDQGDSIQHKIRGLCHLRSL